MRKAQNVVEILLLCVMVIIIAIPVTIAFNSQKGRLVTLSKASVNKQAVNLNTASAAKLSEKIPYDKIETAGTSALERLGGISPAAFESAISNNVTYSKLSEKDSHGQNIMDYAEDLTSNDSLGLSKYKDISKTEVTTSTLSGLIAILNAITDAAFNAANDPAVKAAADGFTERFSVLLNAAQS